jgi:hypothetical protein
MRYWLLVVIIGVAGLSLALGGKFQFHRARAAADTPGIAVSVATVTRGNAPITIMALGMPALSAGG